MYKSSLPESLDALVVQNLVKFVLAKEADHINAKYDKELANLTTQIDSKKVEPNSKSRRVPDSEFTLEDQMNTLLKKIQEKSRKNRFQKDDF
jgi:Mn-containing catalase